MPRICTICAHPERVRIEQALHSASLRGVAAQFDLGKDALQRHRSNHGSSAAAGRSATDQSDAAETRQGKVEESIPPAQRETEETLDGSGDGFWWSKPYSKEEVRRFFFQTPPEFMGFGWRSVEKYFEQQMRAAGIPEPLIPAVVQVMRETFQ